MKKVLSLFTAVFVLISVLSCNLSAYAEEKENVGEKVTNQIAGAGEYISKLYTEFTTENAKDLLLLLKAGVDMEKYTEPFLDDVRSKLEANDGKLITTSEEWYQDEEGNWLSNVSSVESPAAYGAVILVLEELGYDSSEFFGYDVAAAFANVEVSTDSDNPYEYYLAIQAAEFVGEYELVSDLCDKLVADYYVMGKGLDYYGFSCDNTAMFIYSLASYYEEYEEVLDDAIAVLETYKKDTGYYGSDEFTPNTNCDSTALALAAYCALNDKEKADEIYALLCGFELEEEAGIFDYESNTEANTFATKDALFALVEYQLIATDNIIDDDDELIPTGVELVDGIDNNATITGEPNSTTDAPDDIAQAPDNDKKTSPDTGNHSVDIFCVAGTICLLGVCCEGLKKKNR